MDTKERLKLAKKFDLEYNLPRYKKEIPKGSDITLGNKCYITKNIWYDEDLKVWQQEVSDAMHPNLNRTIPCHVLSREWIYNLAYPPKYYLDLLKQAPVKTDIAIDARSAFLGFIEDELNQAAKNFADISPIETRHIKLEGGDYEIDHNEEDIIVHGLVISIEHPCAEFYYEFLRDNYGQSCNTN